MKRRPQPREGAAASVCCLPWTWLPSMPCLSPWQPNSAMSTPHHTTSWLSSLLKEAQLGLLWGGRGLIWVPNFSTCPRSGVQGQAPQYPPIRNIPDLSAWPASAFSRKSSCCCCSSEKDLDGQGPHSPSCPFSGLLLPVRQALDGMCYADDPKQ